MATSVKFWISIAALVAVCIMCCVLYTAKVGTTQPPKDTPPPNTDLTLKLPRALHPDEDVVLRLAVAELPKGTHLAVRLNDGEVAGAISPFGPRTGRKASLYSVPIPREAIVDGKVTLRLEVTERGAKEGRTPTSAEVEDSQLVLVPVTSNEDSNR